MSCRPIAAPTKFYLFPGIIELSQRDIWAFSYLENMTKFSTFSLLLFAADEF